MFQVHPHAVADSPSVADANRRADAFPTQPTPLPTYQPTPLPTKKPTPPPTSVPTLIPTPLPTSFRRHPNAHTDIRAHECSKSTPHAVADSRPSPTQPTSRRLPDAAAHAFSVAHATADGLSHRASDLDAHAATDALSDVAAHYEPGSTSVPTGTPTPLPSPSPSPPPSLRPTPQPSPSPSLPPSSSPSPCRRRLSRLRPAAAYCRWARCSCSVYCRHHRCAPLLAHAAAHKASNAQQERSVPIGARQQIHGIQKQ